MPLDLLEAAKRLLPDSLINKAATSLGETEINIRKALKGAIPAVLAGILHQTSRGEGPGITDLLKNIDASGAISKLSDLLDARANSSPAAGVSAMIPGWLRSVFGGKLINIVNAVSIYSDIKSSSANAIVHLAAPAALGPIAQFATQNNLGPADINALLQSQKSSIIQAIPAGFNLSGSLGINSLDDIGTRIITIEPKPSDYQRSTDKKLNLKWIWPVLLLATFGGLVWFFAHRSTQKASAETSIADTVSKIDRNQPIDTMAFMPVGGKLDSVTGNYIYEPGAEIELKLPDSSFLKVGASSTESRLFKMLTDSSWSIDTFNKTKNWLSFDRVYFETGKSVLTSPSLQQVQNIARILKNFPASSIKIGGYTDNAGDSITNKKISGERAGIVMQELVRLGAAPRQITEAVGYGQEFPVCRGNDSPDCRARNRRVDLKVASK